MGSAAAVKPDTKKSSAPSVDATPETADLQDSSGATAGLPRFLQNSPDDAGEMSDEELEATATAVLAADRIEIALTASLETLKNGKSSANRVLAGNAASAKRTLTQKLKVDRNAFERSCELQDIQLQTDILNERDAIAADFDIARESATRRVTESVEQTKALFAQHRPNLQKAIDDGAKDLNAARISSRNQMTKAFLSDEHEIGKMGVAERNKLIETERDDDRRDEMQEGIRWVEAKFIYMLDENLPEALDAVDAMFLKQPDERVGRGGEIGGMKFFRTVESMIREEGGKAIESFDASGLPTIVEQIQQMLPPTLAALEGEHAQQVAALDGLEQSANAQLQSIKTGGLQRFDALAKLGNDRIDQDLSRAQSALAQAERSVRRQLEPLGREAIRALQEDDPPEPEEAEEVATDLADHFRESADFAVREMADGATATSTVFWRTVRQSQTVSTTELKNGDSNLHAFSQEVADKFSQLQKSRAEQLQAIWDDLNTTLNHDDQILKDQFKTMIDGFKGQVAQTINAVVAQVAQGIAGARQQNAEAIVKVPEAMRAKAEDEGYRYDHRIRHALKVGIKFLGGIFSAILGLLKSVIKGLLIFFVIVVGLLILGFELAVATFIAEMAMIGYMVYEGLKNYQERRDRGQSVGDALVGAGFDITGVGSIVHGFTAPYLEPWERAEEVAGGLGTGAMLFFPKRINEGLGRIANTHVPWLMRRVRLEKGAEFVESGVNRVQGFVRNLPEKIANSKLQGFVPRSIKATLSGWWETRAGGRGETGAPARELGGQHPVEPITTGAPAGDQPTAVVPVAPPPPAVPKIELPPAPQPPTPQLPAPNETPVIDTPTVAPQEVSDVPAPPPSAPVVVPRVDSPQAANDNVPDGDLPSPPSGERPKADDAPAPRQPVVPAGEPANSNANQEAVKTKDKAAQKQAPIVRQVKRMKVPGGPDVIVMSDTPGEGSGGDGGGETSGGKFESNTTEPTTKPAGGAKDSGRKGRRKRAGTDGPDISPAEGRDDASEETPTPAGDGGQGGKVIRLETPPREPEITARPKDVPPPEGTNDESTLVGKTRTRKARKDLYREIALREHPEIDIEAPIDVHHQILKKGG